MIQADDASGMGFDKGVVSLLLVCGGNTQRVARVKIPVDKILTSGTSNLLDKAIVFTVGRTSKRWICACDLYEGILHKPKLVVKLIECEVGEMSMTPSV
jgi:hypothetical protein